MEKAILRTLIYADIFDFPMKAWEIHKWLIGRRASLVELEKMLKKLTKDKRLRIKDGYYFLWGKRDLREIRGVREVESKKYLRRARWIGWILKLVPWVILVGVSGNLAMENGERADDIDLFVITKRNRLWLSRLWVLGVLGLLGIRRVREDTRESSAGKFCVNLILDEDYLVQKKDLYVAHEILQMRVLWQRQNIYQRFLEENDWVFKFLPNWVGSKEPLAWGPASLVSRRMSSLRYHSVAGMRREPSSLSPLGNTLEVIVAWLQRRYMGGVSGKERVSRSALYLHPEDYSEQILNAYSKRVKKLV